MPREGQRTSAAGNASSGQKKTATRKPAINNKIKYILRVHDKPIDDGISETPVAKSAIALKHIPSTLTVKSTPPVHHGKNDYIDATTTPPIVPVQNGSDERLSNESITIPNSWPSPPLDSPSLLESSTSEEPLASGNSLQLCECKRHDEFIAELEQAHKTIAAQSKRILELEGICQDRTESEWEGQVRQLKRQLENAGIQVAADMKYTDIKEKMRVIAASMDELEGGPIVEHTDKKIQAQLRRKYFDLELEMDKLYSAMVASDEYEVEIKDKELTWHSNNINASREALVRVRNCIPVHISFMTTEVLVNELHLHNNAGAYAKRLKSLKTLHVLRMDPQKLRVLHPCELVQLSFSKLSILEKKAVYAALTDVAAEWSSQPSNTLMSEMSALDMHLQPEHNCTLRSQCPATVQARLDIFYETTCIFTKGSEFPVDGDVVPIAIPVTKPETVRTIPVEVKPSSSTPESKTMRCAPINILQAISLRPKIE
ncbi:hypothetical protein THRCLA_11227 [Thraustotheca clavata]|uniref:Uncharacterized protein n=1 Tax=Thraustotheca clavata TaxID=74557 RepID=A0A1V9Y8F1_9STRA|nr:hypothetical protein THRCLA_11227 [Thraustotheca clavata]